MYLLCLRIITRIGSISRAVWRGGGRRVRVDGEVCTTRRACCLHMRVMWERMSEDNCCALESPISTPLKLSVLLRRLVFTVTSLRPLTIRPILPVCWNSSTLLPYLLRPAPIWTAGTICSAVEISDLLRHLGPPRDNVCFARSKKPAFSKDDVSIGRVLLKLLRNVGENGCVIHTRGMSKK